MKYMKFIGYGLLAISVIIIIAFLSTGNFTTLEFPLIDLLLNWTYLMLGISAVLAIVLPLINIVKNPKALIKSLAGIGAVIVILLICYLLSSAEPIVTPAATFDNETALLVSDTGLYATYLAFSVAIITIIAGEIYSVFKK